MSDIDAREKKVTDDVTDTPEHTGSGEDTERGLGHEEVNLNRNVEARFVRLVLYSDCLY